MASLSGRIIKMLLVAFTFLIVLSLSLSLLSQYRGLSLTPYSVTSGAKNGLSDLKNILETQGFETKIIVTDPEAIISIKRNMVYTIIGPSLTYDTQAAFTILSILQNGSSILLVDDFGRINSLLRAIYDMISPTDLVRSILGGDLGPDTSITDASIIFNTTAVVLDAGAYWKNPAYITIKNFNDYGGVLKHNIRSVLAKFASALMLDMTLKFKNNNTVKRVIMPLPSNIGFMVTTPFSWLETNLKSAIDGKATPDPNEWGGIPFSIALAFEIPGGGRMMLIGDPDIFTNDVLDIAKTKGFDNEEFIVDIFEWLAEPTGSNLIVFDESRKALTPDNPLFGVTIPMKIIASFIRYWIIAPLLPITFILFAVSYLPRRFKREIKIFKPTTKKTGTSPYYGRY
ncbi:MAG: hypothetical protein Q6363_009535, partial [Candidatus Njordarchaeota archaeon]